MSQQDGTPLHPLERKVLEALKGRERVDFDSLVRDSGLLPDQIRRAVSWLTSKDLIDVQETTVRTLSLRGEPAELLLMKRVGQTGLPMEAVRRSFGSNQEFAAALGNARTLGWIEVTQKNGPSFIVPKDEKNAGRYEAFVASLRGKTVPEDQVAAEFRPYVERLVARDVAKVEESKSVSLRITAKGNDAVAKAASGEWIERITPEVTAKLRLTGKSPRLRPIDVSAPAQVFYGGRRHPVKEFINEVREVYLSMGFVEIAGDSVQPSFWNFDALFTPQDHPARELQDTFYVKGGRDETIQRTGVVDRVASVHENGGDTGSKGWRYSWNVEEARRLVLRTHNTALTVKATQQSGDKEMRVFSVGRVYRNESLDYKHLAELHQMEGVVIGEGLNLRHLMGVLTRFYAKLGMSGVKLWPSFFPYTEPSMQVMVYYEKVGRWLEMGGSGVFRPEVTAPLGVKKPVIAWGCGLERLLMLRLGVQDIRELYNSNLDWLRRRRDIASTQDIL
jgi:phenylalanyl-tRNA synthetase alpha chain